MKLIMDVPQTQERVGRYLKRLAAEPPQVLLLEGGTADERLALAEHWAALLNCAGGSACGDCAPCTQIRERVLNDLFILDGRQGKIKIDHVRELKPLFGQPARGDGTRVVILSEAQELMPQAANALLKSLEEPCCGTVFVLLAPQRDRLLPTLVSRSWVLTLAWPRDAAVSEEVADWLRSLAEFATTARGWFKRTGAKGAVDKDLAMSVILACQREYTRVLGGQPQTSFGTFLANRLSPASLKKADLALAHAQQSLSTQTPVNPALVLEWLAVRLNRLAAGQR